MTTDAPSEALEDTLAVFDEVPPGTPLTTSEVTDALDVGRRSTYDRLERLVERGRVETKEVGARGRVWWLPPGEARRSTAGATDAGGSKRELRRERDLVEQMLEATPMLIGVFDARSHDLLRANASLAEFLGIEAGDADGYDYTGGTVPLYDGDGDPVPPQERPFAVAIERGEAVFDWEGRMERADGERRWFSISAVPVFEDGEVDRVVVVADDVTRVRAQARRLGRKRDELEDELGEVYDRIDDAFFALDDEWRFVHVNERATDLLDRSAGELIGSTVREVFSEAVESTFLARSERAVETRESVSFEAFYPPLETWFEVTAYPSATGLSVYFRDVTGRKERERELELYETVVETVEDGIYTVDDDGRFTMVNKAYADMLGYSREELLGSHVSRVVPDDVARSAGAIERDLEAGATDTSTLRGEMRTADGETIPAEATFALLPSEHGNDRVGVVRDLSERLERERELELYEAVVENVDEGIAVMGGDRRFLLVNRGFADLIRQDPDALTGRHVAAVLDDSVVETIERRIREYQAGGAASGTFENELALPGGTTRTFETHYTVLPRGDDDEFEGAAALTRDVTDRVERERELERQRERLAALAALNRVVNDVSDAVIDQSTREEVERTVCETIAAAETYEFAWIGDVDADTREVNLRAEAGVEGYLDDVVVSADPADARGEGPTGRAVRTREMQVTSDVLEDEAYGPWRDHAREHGVRSSAAVPIAHEGTLYGVLNVYASRPGAFAAEEQRVFAQLGEIVGHAIAAVERKRALMSDEVVELDYRLEDVLAALDVDADAAGRLTLDRAVPVGDGTYLEYGTVDEAGTDVLDALVDRLDHWSEAELLEAGGDGVDRFELRLEEPPVLSAVASLGGTVERAVVEDGDYRMTIRLPTSADVRELTDVVQEFYPAARLLRRRQTTRDVRTPSSIEPLLDAELTDRQRATLETAYFTGYFSWPREGSGEDVAATLGVSPPTFHQHLRKAQQGLLRVIFGDRADL